TSCGARSSSRPPVATGGRPSARPRPPPTRSSCDTPGRAGRRSPAGSIRPACAPPTRSWDVSAAPGSPRRSPTTPTTPPTAAAPAHAVLMRHPWACGPSISGRIHPARVRYIDAILGRLRSAGFTAELAYHAYHAIDSHVVGFTMWLTGHSMSDRGTLAAGVLD